METLTVSYNSVPHFFPCEVFFKIEDIESSKLKGVAASSGIVEGPCTIIKSLEELPTLRTGMILVCEVPSPALTPYLQFFRGLVARRGGSNCIAAGYARKLEIPAVLGVEGVMDNIHSGDVIRIDGSLGTVEIINQFTGKLLYS